MFLHQNECISSYQSLLQFNAYWKFLRCFFFKLGDFSDFCGHVLKVCNSSEREPCSEVYDQNISFQFFITGQRNSSHVSRSQINEPLRNSWVLIDTWALNCYSPNCLCWKTNVEIYSKIHWVDVFVYVQIITCMLDKNRRKK